MNSFVRYLNRTSGTALLALFALGIGRPAPAAETAAPFLASSVHDGRYLPEYAVDGDPQTRWASRLGVGEEWLQIDFGESTEFHAVRVLWEKAYAADYELLVSEDAATWRSIYRQSAGTGGEEKLNGLDGKGRFLRLLCHRPGPGFGLYSIWELSFEEPAPAQALESARDRLRLANLEKARTSRTQLRADLSAAGVKEIIFATRPLYSDGHWYANFSYYAQDSGEKTYARGGGLYKLSLETGETVPLVEDPEGTLRDPAVHYDGQRIVFSWRPGGTDSFHLFTIRTDGTDRRQLTFGDYDDIEPAWLPDGGLVFVSSRCRRWVNCWLTQVAVLHRCDADGKNILPLSANLEQDNTPWPMPDGRVLYTRWEYVDRSQVDYHHLWAMNPDGTEANVFFGNMHPGRLFIDAKPVPDTGDILFIDSPGHGEREHTGQVALLSVKKGPDELASIRDITKGGYRDPYAVTPDVFLAANGKNLSVMNANGLVETLFTLPESSGKCELHEPRPVVTHTPEPRIPQRTDYTRQTGKLVLTNVYAGRNMADVAPGEIKKLLILESLPKPINYTGGMDPLTYGGSFTLERILGTVPVEEDGSAFMELPANRAFFFVALDANGESVKRMQSFTSVMPGETLSCLGCHEARTAAGPVRQEGRIQALTHPARAIQAIPGIPEVFDFPRDIQPILDKHCLPCHDYTAPPGAAEGPRAGGVILTGDHGPMFSHSYATLTVRRQFVDGRDQPVSNLPPRAIGAAASPLMQKIRGAHHQVQLSNQETNLIRYWIESGAPYPGTYAALGSGSIGGYYANTMVEDDAPWPASRAAAEAIGRRCTECHVNENRLPRTLSDENDLSFWRPEWNDPRLPFSRHLMFNLTRPELSLILLAPLAKESGGYGHCRIRRESGSDIPVFADTADPDYQAILAMCTAGKTRLEVIKRFDMPGFRPPEPYLREMKRYKVLPENAEPHATSDGYALDQAYWRAFEQRFSLQHPAYSPLP